MQSERTEAPEAVSSVSAHVARELFLRTFLGGTDPTTVGENATMLAARVVDMWLPRGHVLYKAGEPSEDNFFIVEGEIEITGNDQTLRLGERSIVGVIDVAQDRPRARTAIATKDTHLLRLRATDWFDVLEDDFDFARGAVYNIANGLLLMHVELGGRGFETGGARSLRIKTGDLSFVDRTLLLRTVPPFRRASVQATVELVPQARLRAFEAGAVIAAKGAPKTAIYVVASGTLSLVLDEHSADFGPGTLVAGMGSFARMPWPAEVRATSDARVLEIDLEDLFDVMEEHFDLVRGAIAELSREREALQTFGAREHGAGISGA